MIKWHFRCWAWELRKGGKVESAHEVKRGGGEREIELYCKARIPLILGKSLNPKMPLIH